MARFVIDESSFAQVRASEVESSLKRFCLTISYLQKKSFQVESSDKIYDTTIGGAPLLQIMYEPDKLDRDLQLLLLTSIERISPTDFNTQHNTLGEMEISPINKTLDQPDTKRKANSEGLKYITKLTTQNKNLAVGCITCVEPSGLCTLTTTSRTPQNVHFILGRSCLLEFFRYIPEVENYNILEYMEAATLAFPSLYFAEGLTQQVRRFKTSWPLIRPHITQHLSALNDHFTSIYEDENFQPDNVKKRFKAHTNIIISPESPNTRKNRSAWEERRITVEGHSLHCEWHTKIFKTHDRIHFHPGSPKVVSGRLIVGIFTSHLST
ncbi:hypothetical protein FRC96_00700 [Lujinxingia vulgaris]|uniref:Uncharacterized protein n=1 Tax=Lujinxingia vulgaris TaxID=2600176 RepID=A0A5C6XLC5_9DELT|nr:hypothetical protein [Lujinxingia vulgaris]TXD44241.1 hypothetical protein FRC96_00700 [Lujinxingia vulgaris]